MLDQGRLDQYEDLELIGESGMAAVYRATDTETGAKVALKIPHLRLEGDVGFYERFQREEAIGLRLDHPGIVEYRRPRDKSRPYIVMEYLEGPTLRARLCAGPRLPASRAVEIARQIAETLVYLHGQRIVHRDLKPENVVLLPDGHVELIDLGIAVDEASSRVGLSSQLGTPGYMAPEQVEGRRGDARVDLFALGTILYEMLTGELPHAAPEPPSRRVPGLDRGLEEIVLRAIEPWPQNRYATAQAMLADLRNPSQVVPGEHPGPAPPRASGRRLMRAAAPFVVIGAIVSSPLLLTYLGGCEARSSTREGWRGAAP